MHRLKQTFKHSTSYGLSVIRQLSKVKDKDSQSHDKNGIIFTLVTLSFVVMVAMPRLRVVATVVVSAAGFTIGGWLHQLQLAS